MGASRHVRHGRSRAPPSRAPLGYPRAVIVVRLLVPTLAVFALVTPASAVASPGLAVPPTAPQVTGGMEVTTCGWPDTVAVTGGGGLCTGSLVHPQVVVTAAHCGDGDKTIRFNEDADSGLSRQAQCTVNPEYSGTNEQGSDWGFCVLDEPVTEIPFTPPLYGCELDMIDAGLPVVIAGFGDGGPDGSAGTKRWGMTEIVSTFGNTANIGGGGISTCQGDSGGSAFVAMQDGTWRALSMTSTGLIGCEGTTGVHALMHPAIPWIEETSGIDITPCHDVDGTWNPTPNCDGFFAGGAEGFGTWDDWCAGTPRGEPSTSCGAAFDAEDDTDPPTVTITSPADGAELDTGALVTITIDAVDPGWGVREVWLSIGGDEQPVRDAIPPYVFADVPFPDGVYEIVAYAEDWAGLVAMSAPVTIGVNAEVPDDPTGADSSGGGDTSGSGTAVPGDTGDESSTGGAGGSTGVPASDDGGGSSGCGCTGATPAGALPLLLVALGRRRRTTRS